MAHRFTVNDGGSYLIDAPAVTAMPLTLACWFNADDVTTSYPLIHIGGSSNRGFILEASGGVASDPVRARQFNNSGTSQSASSSSGYTASTWYHAAGVFTSTTSRAAFLNGGSKGTNTTLNSAPSSLTNFIVGRYNSTAVNLLGAVADVAVWNVALTDAEIAILGTGVCPLFVRPASLIHYVPLIGEQNTSDRRVNSVMSITGSNHAVEAHPRIFYPRSRLIVPKAAADAVVDLTLTKTLDHVTSAASLQVFVATTLATTLGHVTSSSALAVQVQLTFSKTLDSVTLSSDLLTVAPITLELSATLGHVTAASDLAVTVGLSLSKTLDSVTLASSVAVAVQTSLSKTLDNVTAASDLRVLVQLDSSKQLDHVTLSSDVSSQGTIGLTLEQTLGHVTSASSLNILVGLTASKQLDNVTLSAAVQLIIGLSTSKQLDSVALSSELDVVVGLTSAATLDAVTLNSSLSVIAGRVLNLDKTLDSVTALASLVSDIQLALTATVNNVSLAGNLQTLQRVQGGYIRSAQKGTREEEIERDDLEVLSLVLRNPSLLGE